MKGLKADYHLATPDLSHLKNSDYHEVYEPAEDSFLLLDALEKDMELIHSLQPALCLEVGCGSGVVSTCIAKALGPTCFVMATDINPRACTAAMLTAERNDSNLDTIQADLVSGVRRNHLVDLLVFNPPYVVTPSEEVVKPFTSSGPLLHRAWAGGIRGREVTDRLLPQLPDMLAMKSLFYLVVIEENEPEDIAHIMTDLGLGHRYILLHKVRWTVLLGEPKKC